jgi:hypothetical protein
MRRTIIMLLSLAITSIALAQVAPLTFGLGFGAQPNPNPLTLNRLLVSQLPSVFTFLGSWKLPGNITYGAGAIYVSGSTMYLAVNGYNAQDSNYYVNGSGIAAASIPTLTGTPAYDGSNAGAPCNSLPCSAGSGTVYAPVVDAAVTTPANYTVTEAPTLGATSAVFTSAPAGFASGTSSIPNWFVKFTNGTQTQDVLVTSWNSATNTFGWSGGLTQSNFETTVSAYQWNPAYPYGFASGDRMGGSLLSGSTFLISGGAYYDASCTTNLGWLISANATSPAGTFSAVNTVSGYPSGLTGTAALISRRYAGALGMVPTVWQTLLGGNPAFVAMGLGGLSNAGCNIPIGFSFTTFNPLNATGGSIVPMHPVLDYIYQGAAGEAFVAAWPMQLTGRNLTGPFPLCVATLNCSGGETGYYPATLSTAPTAGATTASFVLPSSTVTVTANIVSGSNNLCVTSIVSGGPISNSAIYYHPVGSGIPASGQNNIYPAYDQGPGNPTGTATTCGAGLPGNYTMHNSATATATGETVTLTPEGYAARYYWLCFSDAECRVVHLVDGESGIPSTISGPNDPTTFAVIQDSTGATIAPPLNCNNGCTVTAGQPLSCSPSCTTAVTIAPLGDGLTSEYDGPFGAAFIEPNSRTLVDLSMHEFGPEGARADICASGSSGTNEIPLPPDTNYYMVMQLSLFDLKDALSASTVYQTSPYATAPFPGESAFHSTTLGPGCLFGKQNGFAFYDPVASILYIIFKLSNYTNGSAPLIVYEWSVAPISALMAPRLHIGAAANDEQYRMAA